MGIATRRTRPIILTLVTVAASLVWASGVTAAAGRSAAPQHASAGKPVRVALFTVTTASTYNQQFYAAAKAVVKKMGPATVTLFDASFNTQKQLSQLRDALVSKKFDAWVLNPNDGNAAASVVREALKKGIKVVCLFTPCGASFLAKTVQIPGLVGFVAEGGFDVNGRYIADETAKACASKNPCNVFYMPGVSSAPYEEARTAGWTAELKKYPNIKVVATQDGQYAEATALTVTQNVLQAHPEINVIATASDQMTLGAEKAVAASNDQGKVLLVGNGAGSSGVSAVKAGRWYATVISLPYTQATVATQLAIQAARGASINGKVVDVLQGHPHYITKATAGSFKPQWSGA